MDKYLKWESCNERYSETLPSGKVIEHHNSIKLICDHPAIEKAWITGSIGVREPTMVYYINFILNDKTRHEIKISEKEVETADIPEAEEWLQSLNQQNENKQ
jgi:hypothetical protein